MLKIKILALVIVATLTGGYLYVDHLRTANEVLTANNQVQEIALDQSEQTLDLMKKEYETKRQQLEIRQKQLKNLVKLNNRLKGELNALSENDPALIECLNTVPADRLIDKLRNAGEGQGSNKD